MKQRSSLSRPPRSCGCRSLALADERDRRLLRAAHRRHAEIDRHRRLVRIADRHLGRSA
jgi:hypothetical protein